MTQISRGLKAIAALLLLMHPTLLTAQEDLPSLEKALVTRALAEMGGHLMEKKYWHDKTGRLLAVERRESVMGNGRMPLSPVNTFYYIYDENGYLKNRIVVDSKQNSRNLENYFIEQDFKGRISRWDEAAFIYSEKTGILLAEEKVSAMPRNIFRYTPENRMVMFHGIYGEETCEYVILYDAEGKIQKIAGILPEYADGIFWPNERLFVNLKKTPFDEHEKLIKSSIWYEEIFIYNSQGKLTNKECYFYDNGERSEIFEQWSYGPPVAPGSALYGHIAISDKAIGFYHHLNPYFFDFAQLNKAREITQKKGDSVLVKNFLYSNWLTYNKNYYAYHPSRAFDGFSWSAWLESSRGAGIGDFIGLSLEQPITVDAIEIMPGYFDALWYESNNRLKKLTVETENKRFTLSFKDKMRPQMAKLPQPVTFSEIKFYIKEVYPGKDNDTAISEIKFFFKGKEIKLNLFQLKHFLEKVTKEEALNNR